MRIVRIIIPALVLQLVCIAAGGQQRAYLQIDSIFRKLYASGQFSGNVLIAKNGQPIYQKSFGFADSNKQIANGSQMRFLLASVSKQFTAVGIVLLKEAGRLNYDDKVVKY